MPVEDLTDSRAGYSRAANLLYKPIPVIYFLGTSPGRYQPIIPTFIVGWHPERLRVELAFGVIVGASPQSTLPTSPERRYALREIKARLAPSIVQRCCPERLPRSLGDLPSARAAIARCCSHHHGCGRAIRTADRLEWPTVNEDPSCGPPSATSRRENKKAFIQNEINRLPINWVKYIERPPCNHGK
jgi:hypothetical protein